MTDKRIKMGCPFCGNQKENISIKQIGVVYWYIKCTNPKCGVEMHDESKQRLIDRWNCRV